jgi:thiol-disulfide isomerase/thioredoxin
MFNNVCRHRRSRHRFLEIATMTLAFVLTAGIGRAMAQNGRRAADPRAAGVNSMRSTSVRLPVEGEMPSLLDATAWINSEPLTANGLRGKVVLVEFWTYSCINWRRQLPYVRAWAEKYKDQGLVVIGVHAPEFSFEKNIDNVRWAAKDMRINYPIAAGTHPASPIRRGRIRAVGSDYPTTAHRGRSDKCK